MNHAYDFAGRTLYSFIQCVVNFVVRLTYNRHPMVLITGNFVQCSIGGCAVDGHMLVTVVFLHRHAGDRLIDCGFTLIYCGDNVYFHDLCGRIEIGSRSAKGEIIRDDKKLAGALDFYRAVNGTEIVSPFKVTSASPAGEGSCFSGPR